MKIKIEVKDGFNLQLTRFYHNQLQKIIDKLYNGEYRSYADFKTDLDNLEGQLMNLEIQHGQIVEYGEQTTKTL